MNTPILESGNFSEEKKRASVRLGMPAENVRRERSVIIMYASLPVALSDVTPRKPEIRDKVLGAMMAMPNLSSAQDGRRRPELSS
jgi:hypothetical protein